MWLCCCDVAENVNLGYYNSSGVLQWVMATDEDAEGDIEGIRYITEPDSSGNVWILADNPNDGLVLRHIDTSGTINQSITSGIDAPYPTWPTVDTTYMPNIAQDPSGNVYYAWYEVDPSIVNKAKKWNTSGTLQWTNTNIGFGLGTTNRGGCTGYSFVGTGGEVHKVLYASDLFVAKNSGTIAAIRVNSSGTNQDFYGPSEDSCGTWKAGSANRGFATDGSGEYYSVFGDDGYELGYFDSSDVKQWEQNDNIFVGTATSGWEGWVTSSNDYFCRRKNGSNYDLNIRSSSDGSISSADTWDTTAYPVDIHSDSAGNSWAAGVRDRSGSSGNIVKYNSSLTVQWASDWGDTSAQKLTTRFIRGDGAGGCYVATSSSVDVAGWADGKKL